MMAADGMYKGHTPYAKTSNHDNYTLEGLITQMDALREPFDSSRLER